MSEYAEFIYVADLIGVAIFAITGAIAAPGKRLDILGVVVLGFVTALGGGTIRDITLDLYPLVWVEDTLYLYVAIVSAVAAFIASRYIPSPRRALLVLDAMGLSVFAILGLQKALAAGAPEAVAVMMAVITGVAGGMIRDVLTGQIPLVLQRGGELYATSALLGALVYLGAYQLLDEPSPWLDISAMVIIFITRMAGLVAGLRLPEFIVRGHRLESPGEAREMENREP
ncbi:trimeric intracellular cation channel family protein [Marinobacterium mangrovicola]|uniref:Putative membrane protein YeiH n=1 Tax=Marinobacterium mangrovicola TaxID=1476959 RepID=A0A4V2PEF3_9GAMM|nr:trimeric intracellular cation channel family protein [Marinobacterium mangrovicola]TCK08826.1 putative membrane protein YeiH [Marinobacterium mangrovicola]